MSTEKTVAGSNMISRIVTDSADTIKVLCFQLGGEEFAIDVAHVDEIVQQREIRPAQGLPEFADGCIQHKGKQIPVMDLRKCFDMEPRITEDSFQFIMVSTSDQRVGLVVDSVTGIRKSHREALQPVADIALPHGCNCISGIIGEDEQYTLLINLENLFAGHLHFDSAGCRRV